MNDLIPAPYGAFDIALLPLVGWLTYVAARSAPYGGPIFAVVFFASGVVGVIGVCSYYPAAWTSWRGFATHVVAPIAALAAATLGVHAVTTRKHRRQTGRTRR